MDDPRLPTRFWDKVSPEPNTGCWLWTGAYGRGGYGGWTYKGQTLKSHRAAYAALVGPVPAGLQLDHLCRTRSCCNPDHLQPVTLRENLRRGDHANRSKTCCPHGHLYDDANTYATREGRRHCRACAAIRAANRRQPSRRRKP